MEKENARKQTLEQLHERRKQVVRLHKKAIRVMTIVEMTGLSYPAVRAVMDLFDAGGWSAIRPACRGRSKGDGRALSEVQEQAIQRIIIENRPEQLKMDFCLWSRAAVGQLISQEYGINLQVRSLGKYLTRWGFTPQKPIKRAYVGRTYAGVDGYCPFAVYLGKLGYCLELALRPGVQHSASESQYNFERALPMAASLVATPLLVRADSGFCSYKLMQSITAQANMASREIAFIIKWNPRKSPVETIAAKRVADTSTAWVSERAGKRQCLWQEGLELAGVGSDTNRARRVYRLTERTIDKHGHTLLLPAYVLEGWTTTLPEKFNYAEVIALYCEHATHEQFHSEFKSDMDLERLPSGKFDTNYLDTNYLVCQLAAVAMNLLRLIGQNTLNEPDAPLRHQAKRRRIKTVMQELMFKAARMITHAGRWVLGLGESDPAFAVFERHYAQLRAA